MGKKVNQQKKVEKYLEELKGVFSEEEISLIKTVFSVVKKSIGPDYYEDTIHNCCKELIEAKIEGKEFDSGIPVRETYKQTGFAEDLIPLKTLPIEERLRSSEETFDTEIAKSIICDEYYDVRSFQKIAKKYNLSIDEVKRIVLDEQRNRKNGVDKDSFSILSKI